MAYVIDPTNPASPADTDPASSGAGEFRALKGYIQGLISGGSSFKGYAWQGFRNKIINGDFSLLLRPELAAGAAGIAQEQWGLELGTGTAVTSSRQLFTPGQTDVPGNPTYYRRHVVTASGDAANGFALFRQRVEFVSTFAGTVAVASFYAKADATRTIAVNAIQVFGTGGSPSASVTVTPTKFTLSTNWQLFTLVFNMPSIAGKTFGTTPLTDYVQLGFYFSAGSAYNSVTNTLGAQTGTFDIADVQFEATTNTPFERRPRDIELDMVQRFTVVYAPGNFVGAGTLTGASNLFLVIQNPTKLRKLPGVPTLLGSGTAPQFYAGGSVAGINTVLNTYWSEGGALAISSSTLAPLTQGNGVVLYTEARYMLWDSGLG